MNTPLPLRRFLRGHEVETAIVRQWGGLENGALLDAAEQNGFEVLITCDQNLRYQQNFADRRIAVVILSTNRWSMLRQVAAKVATCVEFVNPGQVIRVDIAELIG